MPHADTSAGLAALAKPSDGRAAFLLPHHMEAAARFSRLFERAHLQPRVTMSYDPGRTVARGGRPDGTDLSDMAADARKILAGLHRRLPADCAGVLIDVCGFHKGLQTVETERGWPRRSAKLVLRIGLEHLALQLGLSGTAEGLEHGRQRLWLGEGAKPEEIG